MIPVDNTEDPKDAEAILRAFYELYKDKVYPKHRRFNLSKEIHVPKYVEDMVTILSDISRNPGLNRDLERHWEKCIEAEAKYGNLHEPSERIRRTMTLILNRTSSCEILFRLLEENPISSRGFVVIEKRLREIYDSYESIEHVDSETLEQMEEDSIPNICIVSALDMIIRVLKIPAEDPIPV
jgi:hypothetical protein